MTIRSNRLEPGTQRVSNVYVRAFDTERVLYVFRKLKLIIECDFQLFMRQMSIRTVRLSLRVHVHLYERVMPRVVMV